MIFRIFCPRGGGLDKISGLVLGGWGDGLRCLGMLGLGWGVGGLDREKGEGGRGEAKGRERGGREGEGGREGGRSE